MKIKALAPFAFLFVGVIFFAFTVGGDDPAETTITISSDRPTRFDMYQNQDFKTLKGLSTPYTFTLKTSNAKFIFKQQELRSLKIKVERNNAVLTADWPITVLIIDNDKLETFGIN